MTVWRGPEDCMICQRNPNPHARGRVEKAEEGGVTEASLHNLHILVDRYGYPKTLVCRNCPKDGSVVEAFWPGIGVTHLFTGFGWGYGGTGPTGLGHALRWLMGRRAPPLEEIAAWDMSGEAFLKSFSIGVDECVCGHTVFQHHGIEDSCTSCDCEWFDKAKAGPGA